MKNPQKMNIQKQPKSMQKNVEKMIKKSPQKMTDFDSQKKHRKMTISGGPKNPDAPKTEKSIFSENVGKY